MSFDLAPESDQTADLGLDTSATTPVAAPAATTGEAFAALGLAPEIVKAILHGGYPSPTDVQLRAVPAALSGSDLLVSSQTGSGKTAAFVWPALQRILDARLDPAKKRVKGQTHGPRILVLAPTRELAQQVSKACSVYGYGVSGLKVAHVVGGVPYQAQLKALRAPLDVLIATPGRLLDLMNSGAAILGGVELLVLDEADRMLDMGFIDDINTIAEQIPAARQTVMFSATFLGHVGRLAQNLLRDPKRIDVASHTDTHENIEQRLHWADNVNHKNALLDHILTQKEMEQALVFTSTQRDADWLADRLADMGHHVASLHGGHPQGRRNRVLQGLRNKQLKILVATDVAARGIDVPSISHVINYGLPMKAEDYVHRIGRTGRAGRNGLAITLGERMDVGMIRRIQQFTTQNIPVAVIEGLEPKSPEPKMFAARGEGAPAGRFGGKPFGKPGFGPGKSFGKKPFAPRSGEGYAPRGGEGFAPRERAPFERDASRFEPRAPYGGDAVPRSPFDRGTSVGRSDHAPAGFAPRKAGAPAGKPGFKPQRPRPGGFSR